MMRQEFLRAASLVAAFSAVLLAGSCASPVNDGLISANGEYNHPIVAAPSYRSLKLSFATPAAGLMPQDEARFQRFVQSYLADGNGAISISPPKGPGASATVRYFGERLAALGVPRSEILVGKAANGGPQVELGYIGYKASTAPCGGWSDASSTSSNLPMSNFGCATQHNLAAMVADPRDLVAPRTMGPSDATRRDVVIGKYEQGKPTAATKTADQTTNVSSETQ